jgi:hypothetical protein
VITNEGGMDEGRKTFESAAFSLDKDDGGESECRRSEYVSSGGNETKALFRMIDRGFERLETQGHLKNPPRARVRHRARVATPRFLPSFLSSTSFLPSLN